MTEPSQYFKGRTVQEQMDEVIGYVDKRAEEVAAAKADDVLQPAEEAKTAAQAAAEAAEAAKNATIAALPEIRQDISDLKTEDTALDGRLDTVELKVTTAEGNIVTIQGQIVALQNVQGDYVKKAGAAQTVTSQIMVPTTATGVRDTQIANGTRVQNDLAAYAQMVRTTGNQYEISGYKKFLNEPFAYLVSSQLKQFSEQTAFLEVCGDGAFTKSVIFDFTESTAGGRAVVRLNITSQGVITETHSVLIGAMESAVGVVRYDGKVYLTLSGQGIYSNVYVRAGGNRRYEPIEIETPFSVANTGAYPDQLVITW